MKLYIAKSSILQGIQVVQRAVPLKSPMASLQSILVTACNNRITFTATDLELAIKYSQTAHIEEEGTMLLPAKLFSDIIRRLPEDMIECESTDRSTVLRYADADFTLNGYDPADYPHVSGSSGTEGINFPGHIPGHILKKLIQQVSFACKIDDETGSVFTGILMETDFTEEGTCLFTLVASDTHRLATNMKEIKNILCEEETAEEETAHEVFRWIIPYKAMLEIGRLLKNDDHVTIEGDKKSSRLIFRFGDTEIITRLIHGVYPDHRHVIPPSCSTKILFDRTALLEAVERASLLSRDSYLKTSIVRFTIEDSHIMINQASEMGRIFEKIPVEIEGDNMKMTLSFNILYIIDALKNIETEKATFDISRNFSACLFRPVEIVDEIENKNEEENSQENYNENYVSLVLPLRH
ncbi:MAG: DNA polymerase III subunit beta [Peptococcaceae bacterium]|nr:DNA polymerase III subunit beta [Peptococcaceae bacterium]